MENKRFIEETFPVREVSAESSREKSIRHGHISTLHIWWARRPLASSRATTYAALIPVPTSTKEYEARKQFIVKLSKWENSLDFDLIERARRDILKANGGAPPRVLDPFAGGGAIPLEVLRLGCETYASDYNPVSTLLLKCTLEYPQKYKLRLGSKKAKSGLAASDLTNSLAEETAKWGEWVLERVRKEIKQFYPVEKDGSIPVGYVWARTIPCQNPSCDAQIPLLRQFWLSSKGTGVSLYPLVSGGKVRFKIVGEGYEKIPKGFEPDKGTISRAIATCVVCGSVVDGDSTRKLFVTGKSEAIIAAVVSRIQGRSGKKYRVGNDEDSRAVQRAEAYLKKKQDRLNAQWGINPIPDEPTPEGKGRGAERAFSIRNYGLNTWGELFNPRQMLALVSFTENVREAHQAMLGQGYETERAKIVTTYMGLTLDRLADYNSSLTRWVSGGEFIGNTFTRQVLPMVWDYFELLPWSEATGDWNSALGWITRVIEHVSLIPSEAATVSQQSATALPYQNDFFDAVITDPPYYDNVPYSYLSDFFYVWLKRSIGHLHPELFTTPLTPKNIEVVAYSRDGDFEAGKKYFEKLLSKSFSEISRTLKPEGVCVIVFAHKSTAGWESLVNSLLDSGLTITSAWPVNTEMRARMRAKESAALASSIYMVARKSEREKIGFHKEVKDSLEKHLTDKLDRIWNEGISGADFFIAAIGSSIEVFGKYEKIIDDEGNTIRPDKMLDDVRRIVTNYAVKQVLHNGFGGEISPLTRFYVLWRWAYGDAKVDYDEARKLAQGVGINLPQEWNRGFIRKEKEFVEVLGPEKRDLKELEGSKELIDVLQESLLLWKKAKNEEILKLLAETGFGNSDVFYRVAQAISESLPSDSREKKLIEGFSQGKDRISEEIRKESSQTRLFE